MRFPHADIIMSDVAAQSRIDNEAASLYGTLDDNLKADTPTVIAAHLNVFAWELTEVLCDSSAVDPEYLASLIQEKCLQAVRQAISDLEEGDLYA